MASPTESARRDLESCARELLLREPFFGHAMIALERAVASDASRPALSLVASAHRVALVVGAPAWNALSPALRRGATKRAFLHLVFKHPTRAHAFPNAAVYALAAYLVIEPYLAYEERDPRDVGHADVPDLGVPRESDVATYYAALLPRHDLGALCMRCASCGMCDRWEDFRGLPSATRSVIDSNVQFALRQAWRRCKGRKWGMESARIMAELDALERPAELSWRRILRAFAATSERTYVKNTLSRPSKRYGTTPGVRVKRKRDIVVAVDTSGSVVDDELAAFFVEIHAMWRRGAIVRVLECDAQVAHEYAYRGRPPVVHGRGGTAFDPAIARANELLPDALVYLTDGHAEVPRVKPRMPTLWVLTSTGMNVEEATALPGRKMKLRTGV